jgi:polysaccharide pyruvyl transferase WcaK-like protein
MTSCSVYIYGYYGYGNLGDDLLSMSIVKALDELSIDGKIYLRCNEDIMSLKEKENVIFTNVDRLLIGNLNLFTKIFALIKYMSEHAKIFKNVHLFILGGGTLLSEKISIKTIFILYLLIALAKARNIDILALGIGISAVRTPVKKWLASAILKSCKVVRVRDQSSYQSVQSLDPQVIIQKTSDLVYSLFSRGFVKKIHYDRPCIGITVVEHFLNIDCNTVAKEEILNSLEQVISQWLAKGWTVKLLSFQNVHYKTGEVHSDLSVLARIVPEDASSSVQIVDVRADEEFLISLYEKLDLIVGMRFHALVLASLMKVPFVGFTDEAKVEDICTEFNMPYLRLNEINVSSLDKVVCDALNLEIEESKLTELKEKSLMNFDEILNNKRR